MECKYCSIWKLIKEIRVKEFESIKDVCAELLRREIFFCPTCGEKL